MLDAEVAPRIAPALTKVVGEASARLARLRLADGGLVLRLASTSNYRRR